MNHRASRGPLCVVVLLAIAGLATPVAATTNYTATGTVIYGTGDPVPNRQVIVRWVATNGTSSTVAKTTNNQGVFSHTWSAATGVYHYVTVNIEGASNSVTGLATRQINWWGGGTRNFGVWAVNGGPLGGPGDVDRDGLSDLEEDRLLLKFAPQVRMHPQDWNNPASVDWILPLSHMKYSHLGGVFFTSCNDHDILPHGAPTYGTGTGNDITAKTHQSASGWPGCNDTGYFHRSDSYSPSLREGFFLQQYNGTHVGAESSQDWVVYGHVYPHSATRVVVQYWFFYAYNDGWLSGNHESDWENVAYLVEPQGNDNDVLVLARYSQHAAARTYPPSSILWSQGHPVVYAAKGSHASYAFYTPQVTEYGTVVHVCENSVMFSGLNVEACDDGGTVWNTWDKPTFGGVVNVGESQFTRSADWLRYSGRWGEIGDLEETSGKKGPAYQTGSWRALGSPELCANGNDDDVDGVLDEPQCNPAPDLTVEDLNPILFAGGMPTSVLLARGDSFRLTGSIVNGGSASAAFTTRIALSADPVYDETDPLLFSFNTPSLSSATEQGLDVDALHPIPPLADGLYYLVAKADSANTVNEGSDGESNNTAVAEFQVEVDSDALRLENFEDDVADGFVPIHGTWDATGGTYVATAAMTDDDATVSLIPSPEASVTLDVDFWVTDQGVGTAYFPVFGAILRYLDASHFLRVETYWHSGQQVQHIRLIGRDGTSGYQILAWAPLPYQIDTGVHHLRIDDRGCQVTVFLDGSQVLSGAYNGTVPRSHRGLFVNWRTQVGFDNFRIRLLEDVDQDGWNAVCGDCNDNDFNVNPGRTENCCTSYDDNCNGTANENCSGVICGGGGCFATGTPIAMADGTTRPIESLQPGDEVLSFDASSGKVVPGKVVQAFHHPRPEQFVVVNGTLRATPNHELYTNAAWLPLDGVMQEDALAMLGTGAVEPGRVRSLDRVAADAEIHDIEVDGYHNYFAGGILVHNKVRPTEPGPQP